MTTFVKRGQNFGEVWTSVKNIKFSAEEEKKKSADPN